MLKSPDRSSSPGMDEKMVRRDEKSWRKEAGELDGGR